MRRILCWLAVLGNSFLLRAGAIASNMDSAAAPVGAAADRELQPFLERVRALNTRIAQSPQSPQAWRYQIEQAELLLQIASRSTDAERNYWQRLAVDCYTSAAIQSPEKDQTARQRLLQLTQAFAGSPLAAYAALQEIQANYVRVLRNAGGKPALAQEYRRQRLLRFAQEFPETPEAPQAVLEAGQISEALGKIDDARCCYHYLAEHFIGHPLARKAEGAAWRLAREGEPLPLLELPLLYSADDRAALLFNLNELHGKEVILYFWMSTSAQALEDIQTLKQLADHYQSRGVEIVQVNLDSDPAQARAFLAGRFTAGLHLFQRGGLDSAVAERLGIQSLPHVIVVSKDGTLIRHSLAVSQVDEVLATHPPHDR